MHTSYTPQPGRSNLWHPITIGHMHLPHRLAMAPMTRSRDNPDGTPGPFTASYYAQRASFGLLISGGAQPSADGQGYLNTPGIHTDGQVAGWQRVTTAVHVRGGHLFIQLMHVGRMAHPDNTPHHRRPVAPSAIAPGQKLFTTSGLKDAPQPRALSLDEIQTTVRDFADAAERAIQAGADGVEIHGANGYLIQQFMAANANRRTDGYGGTIARRTRFALEVAAAVAARIGPERTGIRLSPGSSLGGVNEGEDARALYHHLIAGLVELDLAYVHLVHPGDVAWLRDIRTQWPNALLLNHPNRPLRDVGKNVDTGMADMEPVARWALANPDFPERLQQGAPLNELDSETLYRGGASGYTDYPRLSALLASTP